ncbi:hypothetical protein [Halobaculum sp. D14]|uniref:hypothetical protein n=1 Tax=Halobaculum sp. D14 TaxID=3421642 RepID=UPI003EBDF95C
MDKQKPVKPDYDELTDVTQECAERLREDSSPESKELVENQLLALLRARKRKRTGPPANGPSAVKVAFLATAVVAFIAGGIAALVVV